MVRYPSHADTEIVSVSLDITNTETAVTLGVEDEDMF